jgi:hypothetical protein
MMDEYVRHHQRPPREAWGQDASLRVGFALLTITSCSAADAKEGTGFALSESVPAVIPENPPPSAAMSRA